MRILGLIQIAELNHSPHLRMRRRRRCHPLIYIALSITSFGTLMAGVMLWRMT